MTFNDNDNYGVIIRNGNFDSLTELNWKDKNSFGKKKKGFFFPFIRNIV